MQLHLLTCSQLRQLNIICWNFSKKNHYLFLLFLFVLQDKNAKRNPLLVPYCKLSDTAKQSNYSTACESVRTICRLGCSIIPPASGHGNINQLNLQYSESTAAKARTFRGQKCYKVTKGKWYVK